MPVVGTDRGFDKEFVHLLGDGYIHPSLGSKIGRTGSDLVGNSFQHFQGSVGRTGQATHGGRHLQSALIRTGNAYSPGILVNVSAYAQMHMNRCLAQDFPRFDHGQGHRDGLGATQCHAGVGMKDLENAFVA